MSLLYKETPSYQVYDPRVRINTKRSYIVEKGGQSISYVPQSTQSFSNSQITFTVIPPSNKVIVDRHMRIQIPVQLVFAGADQGGPILQLNGGLNAFRAYPISSVISNIAFTLNNAQFSYVMNDSVDALLHYHNFNEQVFLDNSMSPSMPDQSQAYSDLTGSSRNPLNNYQDSGFWSDGRGSFNSFLTVSSNTNTAATVSALLTEDIYLSPLLFGRNEASGFIGVNSLEFTISLGDLSRMWSHNSSGFTFSAPPTVTISGNPQLLVAFISPQLDVPIPREISYDYQQVINYPTQVGSVLSGANFSITNNNIQLSYIPKMVYLFVRRQNADKTYLTTDTFARINSVSVNFANRTGILASATEQDLYGIAVKNGCKLSYPQWHNFVGSVLCFRPSEDWGLSPLEAPGLANFAGNLQITVNGTNLSSGAITYTMFLVVVNDGAITIADGNVIPQLGVLTAQDVLDSPALPILDKLPLQSIYGGDFLSSLKHFGEQVLSGVKKALPYVKQAYDIGKEVYPIVKPLLSAAGGELVEEGYGNGLQMGGRRVSKAQLRQRHMPAF